MENISKTISEFKHWINLHLQERISHLPENDIAQKRMKDAISHSLLGDAKRIRAFIIEQSCQNYGISREKALPIMIAAEYIHCYSLIHDDLPSMDNSDTRRGKPSLHKAFDEATALLTGNSLVSLATDEIISEKVGFENYIKIHLLQNLSKAIGFHGMMAGQMMDIMIVQSIKSTTEEFIHMNKLKTGELFAFCTSVGAVLSQNRQSIHDLQQVGYDIGYIFQLVDDILDISEDDKSGQSMLAKQSFINHLGGVEDAKAHLLMITEQTKSRIQKICPRTCFIELIDYISNQLTL